MTEYGPPPALADLPQYRISVGGVPFVPMGARDALNWLIDTAINTERVKPTVRLSNSYCVALASHDVHYGQLLNDNAGVNFADGTPIAMLMSLSLKRNIGTWVSTKVRGPSLFREAVSTVKHQNLRHFFLGSTQENLDKIVLRATTENPEIKIAGTYSPPFGLANDKLMQNCLQNVCATNANIVWVGLGTPRQDFVAREVTAATGVVTVAVGAAFDFYAQTISEAPAVLQKLGLEWIYRLLSEPKRLWKRYMVGNTQFVLAVARQGLVFNKL